MLTSEPFDPGALLNAFSAGRDLTGAVVSFTGLCRAEPGETALELEAYPGFTEPAIAQIVSDAVDRFALQDADVIHRTGLIAAGEPIVFVAVAAAHRRAAFRGADFLMDWLKSRAPFWKKSHGPEGDRWIEPRPQDYDDAARWDALTSEPERSPA